MGKSCWTVSFGVLLSFVTALAIAADYPAKPVRLVVPFPPGGTLDILARGLGPGLSGQLGQQIVVDNRPGANGVIAYELVAKAAPDGYTLLIGGGSGIAVHPAVLSKLPYDPAKAFAPVVMLASFASVLVANPSFPVNSVQELIALASSPTELRGLGISTISSGSCSNRWRG
jgi:tripartite-type tricarboxylate transporter receptor subunit TctC